MIATCKSEYRESMLSVDAQEGGKGDKCDARKAKDGDSGITRRQEGPGSRVEDMQGPGRRKNDRCDLRCRL